MDLRHLCLLLIGKARAKHRTYVRHYVCLLLINKAKTKYKTLYILDTYSPHTRHMECVLFFNSFPWFLILFLTGGGKSPMYCSEFHKWKIQFHTNYPWVYYTTFPSWWVGFFFHSHMTPRHHGTGLDFRPRWSGDLENRDLESCITLCVKYWLRVIYTCCDVT